MDSMGRIRLLPLAFLMLSDRYHGTSGAHAELVWPEDARARLAEAQAASGAFPYPVSWPVTAGELGGKASCASAEACPEADGRTFRATLALGGYGLRPFRSAGEPFETFDPGWGSVRIDPEFARSWTRLPPVLSLELRHAFSGRVFTHFRMGLRRDLSAWRQDDLALNLPVSEQEIDLNEPSFGYLHYAGDWAEATVGRFPVHWGPSPDFSLALSSAVPYHNAVQAVLKGPRLRYRFLVSSLNPWLEGTPPGGAAGTDYPVDSEEWRQRNYPVLPGSENAHRRVYDQRVKTLIAHRLETWAGPVTLGVTETQIIGGKAPDLREANPFAIFHNDFHEGYANNNVSVDALARLPHGLSLGAEVFMDDLEWSETEGRGATPSLLGYLAALRHVFQARGWTFVQSLHGIYTDPFLYGFLQPLNSYSSRHILTSNNQADEDPVFVDKYVADYPLGYLRGGDVLDFWYRAEALGGDGWAGSVTAGWLSRGEIDAATPFERFFLEHGSAPSGTPEREFRISVEGGALLPGGLRASAGAGWQGVFAAENRVGRDRGGFQASAGLAWSPP